MDSYQSKPLSFPIEPSRYCFEISELGLNSDCNCGTRLVLNSGGIIIPFSPIGGHARSFHPLPRLLEYSRGCWISPKNANDVCLALSMAKFAARESISWASCAMAGLRY